MFIKAHSEWDSQRLYFTSTQKQTFVFLKSFYNKKKVTDSNSISITKRKIFRTNGKFSSSHPDTKCCK